MTSGWAATLSRWTGQRDGSLVPYYWQRRPRSTSRGTGLCDAGGPARRWRFRFHEHTAPGRALATTAARSATLGWSPAATTTTATAAATTPSGTGAAGGHRFPAHQRRTPSRPVPYADRSPGPQGRCPAGRADRAGARRDRVVGGAGDR